MQSPKSATSSTSELTSDVHNEPQNEDARNDESVNNNDNCDNTEAPENFEVQVPNYHSFDVTKPLDHSYCFVVFHTVVFDAILSWYQTPMSHSHPFRTKWRKYLYLGLTRYNDYADVAKICSFKQFSDYILTMQESPDLKASIEWDWVNDEFRYWLKNSDIQKNRNDILDSDENKIDAIRDDFLELTNQYNSTIKDLCNRVRNATFEIETLERKISGKATMLENQFRHELHSQTERLQPMMDDYVQDFSKKIATHSDSMVTAFTSKMRGVLTGHETTLSQSVSAFKNNINDVVTKATETVNTNLNSITTTLQQRFVWQAEEVTINFHQMVQEANESRFNTPKVTQPARDTHPAFITATTVKDTRDPLFPLSNHQPTIRLFQVFCIPKCEPTTQPLKQHLGGTWTLNIAKSWSNSPRQNLSHILKMTTGAT